MCDKKTVLFLLLGGISLWFFPSRLTAQRALPASIQVLDELYTALQFDATIKAARELLQNKQRLSPQEIAYAHQYLGLAFYSIGKLDSARSHFYSLLSVDPGWKMDPVKVSPKIIAFFEQLKVEGMAPPEKLKIIPYVHYVFLPDVRVRAGWRSLLLPGWGQLYKKQKRKALITGAVFYPSLIAMVVCAIQEKSAHEKYRQSQSLPEIEQHYRTYNAWHKRREVFSQITIFAWGLSLLDALWAPYDPMKLVAYGDRVEVRLAWRF